MLRIDELAYDPEFVQTITRLRPTTTTSTGGLAANSYATASVIGCVQPLRDTDAQLLPEGVRLADCQAFWTADDVSIGDGVTQNPDLLQIGGVNYRVIHQQDYRVNGYIRVIVARYPAGTVPAPAGGGTP